MTKQYDKNMISTTNDNENLVWYDVNDEDFDLYGTDRGEMMSFHAVFRRNLQRM